MSDRLKLTSEQFSHIHHFASDEAENFIAGHESTTYVVLSERPKTTRAVAIRYY